MLTAPQTDHRPTQRAAALLGAKRVVPFLAGVAPLGFAIGAAGSASSLPPLTAWASAVIVYGGSIQLVVLHLVESGAAPAVVAMGAMLATIPRCLYAVVIGPGLGRSDAGRRALDAYLLVEPSFAVTATHLGEQPAPAPGEARAVYLGAGGAVFATWMLVTGLGAGVGGQLPTGVGIEMLVPVMMLALAVGTERTPPAWAAALVAGAAGIGLAWLPFHLGYLTAVLAGVGAAAALEHRAGGES
jgi:predicted branched-subunit amino acid permease